MMVPLMFYPPKVAARLSRPLYGIASRLIGSSKSLENDLFKLDDKSGPVEYMSLVLLNVISYFVALSLIGYGVLNRAKVKEAPLYAFGGAILISLFIYVFCIAYPRWTGNKKTRKIDRDLLYAARHLRIQTTAGVPLFNSLVSATHGYGTVSEEISKIVTNVQAGESLASALEESAKKNPSYYYNRILWQMSNAVKAGSDVGPVLSEIVDFLAEEQRIEMRNYGAQLNTLAIMYLMMCIIVPTISLIFMLVVSSFVELPITDSGLLLVLGMFAFIQYMFIGIIENRRPSVSI
jgi:pilus assembly protein TadC